MKYWTELNELDDAVYKVHAVNSGLQILGRTDEMTSADSGLPEEFQTFLADLNDRMDEAVRNLKEKFQNVWDVVRDEDDFEESMTAIDELEQEQADKVRFQKIVDSMIPHEVKVREMAANAYPPKTMQDEFDEAWAEQQSWVEKMRETERMITMAECNGNVVFDSSDIKK